MLTVLSRLAALLGQHLAHDPWRLASLGLCAFIGAGALSALWALYFRYSMALRPVAAANADLALVLVSSLNVIGYTHDARLLLPYVLGSWLGSYLAVRQRRHSERKTHDEKR